MPKAGYHHGNLRQALVDAALEVIERDGATGFTLARAAKSVGVTPAAVYRHFKGRDDLLAEVARQGHERLALLTDTAIKGAEPGLDALAYAAAFLTFADHFPGHFAAIYLSGIPPAHSPALEAANAQSAGVRARLAERLSSSATAPGTDAIAAHLHALCIGSVLAEPKTEAADTLKSALALYLGGLGIALPPNIVQD